jgi:hypothetical protein
MENQETPWMFSKERTEGGGANVILGKETQHMLLHKLGKEHGASGEWYKVQFLIKISA